MTANPAAIPQPSSNVPLKPQAPRLANIDRLRILAVADIIVFHYNVDWGMRGSLSSILVLLVLFAVPSISHPPRPFGRFVRERAARLLVPWLAWTLIYAAIEGAMSVRAGNPFFAKLGLRTLLAGPQLHLWFLPLGFVVSLVIYHAGLAARSLGTGVIAAITLPAAFVAALAHAPVQHMDMPVPQWAFSLPALPIGLWLAFGLRDKTASERSVWGLVTCIFAAGLAAVWFAVDPKGLGLTASWLPTEANAFAQYAIAAAVVGAALLWRGTPDRVTTHLAALSMGAYLVQFVFILIAKHFPFLAGHPFIGAPLVVVASFAAAAAMRATPLRVIL